MKLGHRLNSEEIEIYLADKLPHVRLVRRDTDHRFVEREDLIDHVLDVLAETNIPVELFDRLADLMDRPRVVPAVEPWVHHIDCVISALEAQR